MKKKKVFSPIILSFIIISLLFSLAIILYFLNRNYGIESRFHHHIESNIVKQPNISTFSTHLPIVIIDTNGNPPKADSKWSEEKGYRVPVDYDHYVEGTVSIIDNENQINSILDKPDFKSNILIRLRGNSSLSFDKKQYLIKLVDKNGMKKEADILGMGSEWEWILNISFIDKSLIRNYMCFNIAAEIMGDTPDVRYCEVFMKNGSENEYLGVYLMMESVKRGSKRINISKYDSHFKNSSYILRRDRFDEEGIMLKNYGTINNLTEGFLEIKYPYEKDIRKDTIKFIEEEISDFEKAIFSDDPNTFYNYTKYIDKDSFIDYFIINEFFTNYDAGFFSTYMHKENREKIEMGPVWDFDGTMDNYIKQRLDIYTTAMQSSPWYTEILKDGDFVTQLIKRYHELRKGILSNENIINYIDDTVAFLGPAQKRDWKKWEYFYTSDYLEEIADREGTLMKRNTKTYDEEIIKIKTILTEHGNWLDKNIDSLYQFSKFTSKDADKALVEKFNDAVFGEDRDIKVGSILAILFLAVFIISIILVQRD